MTRKAVPFTSERLLFRELTDDDVPALAALYADPDVMRFIGKGDTKDEAATAHEVAWIRERYATSGYGLWATVLRETGELIGRGGLLDWEIDNRPELEVGYLLGQSWWGQGLGSEAARAVSAWAHNHLGATGLISLMYPDNTASIRVALANGMAFERDVELFGMDLRLYRDART